MNRQKFAKTKTRNKYMSILEIMEFFKRNTVVIRKFVSRQLSGNSFPPFHPPWGIRLSRNSFPPNCPPCHHSAGGLNNERTQRRVCRIGDQEGDFGETENGTGRGQARDQQAIREQAQEGLFRKGAVVLCSRKQRKSEALEDGP